MNEMIMNDPPTAAVEADNRDYYLDRPPLLSEYLPGDPKGLLKKAFVCLSTCDTLNEMLSEWLSRMGTFPENAPATFQHKFYNALPGLVQALYGLHRNVIRVADPHTCRQTINGFCRQFPRTYVQRELWCFVSAVQMHAYDNKIQYPPDKVLDWYEQVSCLAEAAYLLNTESN